MRATQAVLPLLALIICFRSAVRADTEIRNLRLPLTRNQELLAFDQAKHLTSEERQLILSFDQTDPEAMIWLKPSNADERYSSWTVRLSWPGSSPTSFDLHMQPQGDGVLLRIQAAPLSPRIPTDAGVRLIGRWLSPILSASPPSNPSEWSTPAHLVFEPLILGAVPRTTLRTVGVIVTFAAGAALAVPRMLAVINGLLADPGRKSA